MNNEMKFEKNGLLIPNGALEELGVAGISLSAWLGQDHILLMPQEMTAEQLLHALDGLSQASVELLGVLQEACRMPCAGDCERDIRRSCCRRCCWVCILYVWGRMRRSSTDTPISPVTGFWCSA